MSEATPTTTEDAEARALAEQAGLEYREAGAVAVDPRALSILPAAECRRLRAVPLAAMTGSVVIAVSDPNEERLEAVRQLTGPSTRFVVLTERTLDALLRSRMFAGGAPAEPASEPAVEHSPEPVVDAEPPLADHQVEPPREPEPAATADDFVAAEQPSFSMPVAPAAEPPPPPPPPPPAPEQPRADNELVDAIVAALGPRLQSLASLGATVRTPSEPVGDSIMDPVARVDAAIEAWSSLRAALETIGEELDASRQSLREAKEQLSVAHAENDQHQLRIDALEAELGQQKSLVDEARNRLQDAAKALGVRDPSDAGL
jgi:hypothetical protein